MAEIDETKIDRDFLAILRPKLLDFSHRSLHPNTIRMDGIWMVRRRLQGGAEKFLTAIYRWLLRFVGNETVAEDLLSDVFLDVWRQAGRFEGRSAVATWLLSISRFKALSTRHRQTHAELDETIEATVADPTDDPEVMLEKKNEQMRAPNPTNRLHCQHSPTARFESKRAAHQAQWEGVNFGRRSPSSGGQNCTPNNSEVVKGLAHVRVARAERFFTDRQSAFEEPIGLRVFGLGYMRARLLRVWPIAPRVAR
jgi:Sigma-70 region 2